MPGGRKTFILPTACSTVQTGHTEATPRKRPIRPRYTGEEQSTEETGRPPTRQLSPKDAVGLELPDKPISPIDFCAQFDHTWAFRASSKRVTPIRTSQRLSSRRTSTQRPEKGRERTPVIAWLESKAPCLSKPIKATEVMSTSNRRVHSAAMRKLQSQELRSSWNS